MAWILKLVSPVTLLTCLRWWDWLKWVWPVAMHYRFVGSRPCSTIRVITVQRLGKEVWWNFPRDLSFWCIFQKVRNEIKILWSGHGSDWASTPFLRNTLTCDRKCQIFLQVGILKLASSVIDPNTDHTCVRIWFKAEQGVEQFNMQCSLHVDALFN